MLRARKRWLALWLAAVGPGVWNSQAQVAFTVAPAYPAGAFPISVAAGDFNGDGKPDLAVANQNGSSVSILLNDGNGGFRTLGATFPTGSEPQFVAVGDFNQDGRADLAVATTSNTVSILLGNGDGTFRPAVSYQAGSSPRAVAVGDFNGDGIADLAVADYGNVSGAGGGISMLLGNGNGTFKAATLIPAGTGAESVAVGDFNGDTRLDLAVANSLSNNISVLLGNGNGAFQPVVNYSTSIPGKNGVPTSVVVGDFNRDGILDLAAVSPSLNDISILLGLGNGGFQPPAHYGLDSSIVSVNPNSLAVADLNGDGTADLIVANFNADHVSVLLGNGDGTFPAPKSYAAGAGPKSAAVADFNGDGLADIAVANNSASGGVSVLLGNGDGTLQAAALYHADYRAVSTVTGDLDGDGNLDLAEATSYSGTLVTLLGHGDGTFQAPAIYPTGGESTSVALGDFNGDGKPDLVTADNSSGVSVFVSNGNGTFQARAIYAAGQLPRSVAVGDLNGDGKADLAVANLGSDNISVLLGNGNGKFQTAVSYPTPAGGQPYSVAIGDLNRDGKLDLAVTNSNSSSVSILLGNGDGSFQAPLTYPTASSPHSVAIADFNGDGHLDLAIANWGNSSVSVLLGNGDGTFQTALTYGIGSGPETVIVADFNQDLKPDLAVASGSGLSVLLGNGDGTMQAAVNFTLPAEVGSVGGLAAGDFNGDGKVDLAMADASSDTVAILLNTSVIPPVQITIDSSPSGLTASIDGTSCTTPCVTPLSRLTQHTIAVLTPQAGPTGTQYVFTGWSDGGAISHSIMTGTSAATYTASFGTQYQLTTAASPAEGGTVSPNTGAFYDAGTVVQITAAPNANYVFSGWSGPVANAGSAATSITMTAPASVTASFSQLSGVTIQTNPAGLQFSVDGNPAQTAPQTLNLPPGLHTIAVSTPEAGPAGTQYVFLAWSDGGAASHTITVGSSPATLTASFTTQYQLSISASPAEGGTFTPASGGFYDSGSVVAVSASANDGYIFVSWSGSVDSASSSSTTVTMSAPQTVTANFSLSSGHPLFFAGEGLLSGGDYYLQFPNGNLFGYYSYVSSSILYHFDMGYEAYVAAAGSSIYFYDFASGHWWFTSASQFPYLYDFTLSTWIYYYPDTMNAGHYTTNPRYFVNLTTQQIFTM